jgi:hypothetical protein
MFIQDVYTLTSKLIPALKPAHCIPKHALSDIRTRGPNVRAVQDHMRGHQVRDIS